MSYSLKKRVVGQLIQLRTINIDDYIDFFKWSKDEMFCLANGWDTNRSKEEIYDWLLRVVTNKAEDFVRLGIEYDGRLIGYGDLACIKANIAEIGIAIGERFLWGKGIGSCAVTLVMQYGSKMFDVNRYTAETHETNIRSRRMLRNVGFTQKSTIGREWYQGKETKLIQYEIAMKSDTGSLNTDSR